MVRLLFVPTLLGLLLLPGCYVRAVVKLDSKLQLEGGGTDRFRVRGIRVRAPGGGSEVLWRTTVVRKTEVGHRALAWARVAGDRTARKYAAYAGRRIEPFGIKSFTLGSSAVRTVSRNLREIHTHVYGIEQRSYSIAVRRLPENRVFIELFDAALTRVFKRAGQRLARLWKR